MRLPLPQLLALALCGVACTTAAGGDKDAGSTADGGVTSDGGVVTDGGVTTDGGPVVDPNIGYQTSFESPVVSAGVVAGQFPSGWSKVDGESVQDDSLAGVYRPSSGELEDAVPDGQQVLALADADQPQAAGAQLKNIVFVRPGETWEVTMKVAYSKTVSDFSFLNVEADGDFNYIGEANVDNTTLTTAGTFQTVTLRIPSQSEPTQVSLFFFGRAMQSHSVRIFVDDLKIRRTSSPDSLPIQPVHAYVLNPSFESPQHGADGFDSNGAPGWTRALTGNGFASEYYPTAPVRVTQAAPLAAPATGNQVVDMGTAGGGTTEPMTASMTSSTFAIAEAGSSYSALVAVGQRLDLNGCQTARVAILADGAEIAHIEQAGSATPKGSFVNMGTSTGAITAANAGKELKIALTVTNGVTTTDCRLMFDNARGWKE